MGIVEQSHQRGWLRERLKGRQGVVEEDVAVLEPAQVDAHCARVDADDARHL